jgi:WD40 repeat protein
MGTRPTLVFHPDGGRLACTADSQPLKIIDIIQGRTLRTFPGGQAPLAFSPDGLYLAAAAAAPSVGRVRVWELASGREVRLFQGHPGRLGRVSSIAFSADGQHLVTCDGSVKVWEVHPKPFARRPEGFPARGGAGALSPDHSRLAAAVGNEVKVWEVRTGRLVHSLAGHTQNVNSVAFSPDSKSIASASAGFPLSGAGEFKVWDAATGRELRTLCPGGATLPHPKVTYAPSLVTYSPDGRYLAGTLGCIVKVWEASTGRELLSQVSSEGGMFWIGCLGFSPDGNSLATGRGETPMEVWETTTGKETISPEESTKPTASLAFSPDGRFLAGASEMEVRLWDAASGRRLGKLKGHTAPVTRIAFSRDAKRAATVSLGDGTVRVWDPESGQELLSLPGTTAAIWELAFTPDGGRLVCASADGVVKVWDARPAKGD